MSKVITEWHAKEFIAKTHGQVINGMDRACQFAAGQARSKCSSKRVAAAIDYEVRPEGNDVVGYVGVSKRSGAAFIGYFLEVGTSGHAIVAKRAKVLTDGGEVFGRKVRHPGTRARPFLRPAVFENGDQIVKLIAEG